MKRLKLKLFVLLCFCCSPTMLIAKSLERKLSEHFLLSEAKIIEGKSKNDLLLASYQEDSLVVFVIIGHLKDAAIFYTELSDLGGSLISIDVILENIQTIYQSHDLTCDKIKEYFSKETDFKSICDVF
jgi:hypothetical protein